MSNNILRVVLVSCLALGCLGNISPYLSIKDIIDIGRTVVDEWKFDPEYLGLDPYEHIIKAGYSAEKHQVITSDGYILALHRIPNGRTEEVKRRPPILLQPGLLCTASCYIDLGPTRAIAFFLADLGFDVWIGNARGSTFSRNHTTLSTSSKAFWDFSWHEIGTKDLPAVIDYILETTNHKKLSYIGHSQGTTAFFVLTSELPEYNKKIRVMVALAPVAFMEHLDENSSTVQLAKQMSVIKLYLKLKKVYELLPHYEPFSQYVKTECMPGKSNQCIKLIDNILGYNPDMFEIGDMPVITSHFPGGAAVKQFEHYAQLILYGGFKKFDYGNRKNQKMYGQKEVPSYDLSNVNVPIFLFYGPKDTMSTENDVGMLDKALTNSKVYRIPYELFNHGDFLWGKKVFDLLYHHVFNILMSHHEDLM